MINDWKSVNPPICNGRYLVTTKQGFVTISIYTKDNGWHSSDPVIAWKPLPLPYQLPFDEDTINKVVGRIIDYGQHDPQFRTGEKIKYSPSDIERILRNEY